MTWRRSVLFLLLLVPVAGCGDRTPIPHEDGLLRIRPGVDEVALGQAFPLEVVRVWSKQSAPEPWNDVRLAPLAVRLEETSRREDDSHVQETRRYSAYAFSLTDVTVGDKTLRVKRALDERTPGPAELPGPLARGFPWAPILPALIGGLALAVVALLFLRTRSREEAPPPPPPQPKGPAPRELALARLSRLRNSDLDVQPFYREATELLREFLGARFGIPALKMTTEEITAAAPAPLLILNATLRHCDHVKFAPQGTIEPERESTLDRMEQFIRETA